MGGPLVGGNSSFNGGVLLARPGRLPLYGAMVQGKILTMIIMDKENMVWETLTSPLFCESLLSLAVARKLSIHEVDNLSQ